MTTEIRVRPARKSDAKALADLYVENHDFQRRGFPQRLKATSDAWKRDGLPKAIVGLLDRGDAAIFVVEIDSEVVGLVDVYERSDFEVEGRPARRHAEVQTWSLPRGNDDAVWGIVSWTPLKIGPEAVASPTLSYTRGSFPRGRSRFMSDAATGPSSERWSLAFAKAMTKRFQEIPADGRGRIRQNRWAMRARAGSTSGSGWP